MEPKRAWASELLTTLSVNADRISTFPTMRRFHETAPSDLEGWEFVTALAKSGHSLPLAMLAVNAFARILASLGIGYLEGL